MKSRILSELSRVLVLYSDRKIKSIKKMATYTSGSIVRKAQKSSYLT